MGKKSTVRSGPRTAVALAMSVALLGACAHTGDQVAVPGGPSTAPTSVSPRSSSPAPSHAASTAAKAHRSHRPYSDVNPPPRRGGDFVVKVLIVTRDKPGASGPRVRQNRTGWDYYGEEVRTCLSRSSHHRETVGWKDWRAEDVNGRTYPADPRDTSPLRRPTYPFHRVLSPGQCATGYWLITVPKGADIRAIQFAPAGGPVLIEWLMLR